TTPSHAPPRAPGRALLRRPDALLRHLHPLDAFEAEQELNTIRRGSGGGLLEHGAEGLLDILAELHALDRQVREVDLDALIRSKHRYPLSPARAFLRDACARSGQAIGLRGHDEVVAVKPADLVGPPGH